MKGRCTTAAIAVGLMATCHCLDLNSQEAWRLVVVGDTHIKDNTGEVYLKSQIDWILANRTTTNICFVTHVGDVIEGGSDTANQWRRARDELDRLEGVVPYSVSIGNHDFDNFPRFRNGPEGFRSNFGPNRERGWSWPAHDWSPNELNSAMTFLADGRHYVHLNIEYNLSVSQSADAAWVLGQLETHNSCPTIISTHSLIRPNYDGPLPFDRTEFAYGGSTFFDTFIKPYNQVFLVISGHQGSDGYMPILAGPPDDLQTVHLIVSAYTSALEYENGYFRLLTFDGANDRILVETITNAWGGGSLANNGLFISGDGTPRTEFRGIRNSITLQPFVESGVTYYLARPSNAPNSPLKKSKER